MTDWSVVWPVGQGRATLGDMPIIIIDGAAVQCDRMEALSVDVEPGDFIWDLHDGTSLVAARPYVRGRICEIQDGQGRVHLFNVRQTVVIFRPCEDEEIDDEDSLLG